MPTGLVYDERFLLHDTGAAHPERPDRLRAIVERLRAADLWERLTHVPATPAAMEHVLAVHEEGYIERLRDACAHGSPFIDDPDSAICPQSYAVAMLAAGGVVEAARRVAAGELRNAFCAVRPPGHHAERDRSMGFCLINNVAVAAQYLRDHAGVERVAIVDFDVHHGNGTQHIFEHRDDVLYISLHEHPAHQYPGTGFSWEKGKDRGEGATMNLPMEPGSGDEAYREAFGAYVLPALEKFRPGFLLLSAGFDASEHDPLGHLAVTAAGFLWMTRQLKSAAERLCGGKIVSCLEGGYNLRSLAECVAVHVGALMHAERDDSLMAMKAGAQ